MNLDNLGDFPRSPPYFGYNSAGSENPFCVFYCFRDLYRLKLTEDFSSINNLPNMMDLSFETTQTEPGGGIEHGWRAHPPRAHHVVSWPPRALPAVHQKSTGVLMT